MDNSAWKIVRLQEEHLNQLMEIEQKSFTIPWSKEAFLQELTQNPNAYYYIVLEDDKVLAYAGLWKIYDEGHITNIAVHPDYRRLGVGNFLVRGLISEAKDIGIGSMTLEVRKGNVGAQRLYEGNGFYSVGVRPKYYGDNGEDAVIMWRD